MLPLIELIRATSETLEFPPQSANLTITGIAADSRHVKPGTLYVALKGEKTDGATFAMEAKQAGAVAVLASKEAKIEAELPVIRANEPRLALAQMAAKFYGRQPKHMVAITGTDGKTSTADFYRQFWQAMGKPSASIGTLGILGTDGKELYPGTHTTPNPVQLHKILSELNADYVAMEASSHGLHQHRLSGVILEAAAYTNIARDHLDYHKTEEAYFAAKASLFSALLPAGQTAVLNQDDSRFSELKALCEKRGHRIIGFGKQGSEFAIKQLELLPHGQKVKLSLFGKEYALHIPLVGAFQTMNIMAALGLVVASGGDLDKALAAIATLKGVPGRLEQVATLANGASVFVDYAHTPAALANILKTLRPHTQHKLHVVFGCGGDRDAGKRPEMGKAASELADAVIVTDDNPRSENPATIRKAILAASPKAKEVGDRRQAIMTALQALQAGDILVIAGKGHEKTQTIGKEILPFDDAQVVRESIKELRLVA